MDEPDIRILVGNKGDDVVDGTSAALIRKNLNRALSAGIKIKVGLDQQSAKALRMQLTQMASGIKISVGPNKTNSSTSGTLSPSITEQQQNTLATEASTNAQKRYADATSKATLERIRQNKTIADGSLALARFNDYLMTINPKGLADFGVQIAKIRTMFASKDPLMIKSATAEVNKLKAAFKSAGYEGGNIFTYLSSKIKTFATYMLSSALTMGLIKGIREIISTVKQLDSSLTDLRIVTGGTREETHQLLTTYNKMAHELGSTTKNVADAAVNWQRQGYSLADTNQLLKDSMVLSIVGSMESTEAATALTAALKGYKLEAEDASSVVDKFFAVDMKAATSSSKMAVALSKTAANAKLAGLSLDEVIGQLAQVNSAMQEGGEQTGTFYNTMLSRMGALKSGRLSDPETSEDLSDVEATLSGLGIRLRDSESEFRSFGEVLDEVGGKWESFSSVQQRAIATAFSGTRQQTRFLSLMSGWDQAQKYTEVAAGSAGTALEKFSIYEESIEAKTNRMTNAFENFSATLLDSGLIGGVLDFGTGLLTALSAFDAWPAKIAIITTSILTLTTAISMFQKSSFASAFTKMFGGLGWPKMTGDKWIIVPSYGEETA